MNQPPDMLMGWGRGLRWRRACRTAPRHLRGPARCIDGDADPCSQPGARAARTGPDIPTSPSLLRLQPGPRGCRPAGPLPAPRGRKRPLSVPGLWERTGSVTFPSPRPHHTRLGKRGIGGKSLLGPEKFRRRRPRRSQQLPKWGRYRDPQLESREFCVFSLM